MQSGTPADGHIDNVYAALLGEMTWETFLSELVRDIPSRKASLFYFDEAANSGAFSINTGLEESSIASFQAYYSSINPLMHQATRRPLHKGTVAQEMSPPETFHRSEFYNDYMLPMKTRSAVGVTIMQEASRHFFLTALTQDFDFDQNTHWAARLSAVSPHLRRAFDLYRRNSRASVTNAVGGPIMDAYAVGSIVLGEGAVPKHVSRRAGGMLEEGAVIRVGGERLTLRHADADRLMCLMASRRYTGPKTATFLCERHRVTLVSVERDAASLYFEGPSVLVLIEPALRPPARPHQEALRLVFGVSRAEARVMAGLLEGLALQEIADMHGVSSDTVKTQARSVYAKCRVSGRQELIRTLNLSALRPDTSEG